MQFYVLGMVVNVKTLGYLYFSLDALDESIKSCAVCIGFLVS